MDDELHEKVLELSEEGNRYVDVNNFDAALERFERALNLVPSPKNNWEASLWLYASIGDMYYLKDDYRNSADNFYNALNCPDGQTNSFVHLRLGEDLYELGDNEAALEHLLRAYMLEGKEIFADEDKKYLEFLSEKVELE